MKKQLIILILVISLFIIDSCKDFHPFDRSSRFWVQNDSRKLIFFLVSYNYPDTIIPDTYDEISNVPAWDKSPYDKKGKWKKIFEELPADKLSIFIFESDSIEKYDWDEIRSKYIIAKRYDLSYDDMEKNDWIVTYP